MRKPRPHWTEAVKAENAALRQQLDELRQQPHVKAFAREVADNIMLMLANKPFEQWPDLAKHAYRHAAERQETSAYLYRKRLPQA